MLLRNGSLWADVFLVKDGASPNPSQPNFDPEAVHHSRKCTSYSSTQVALFILIYDHSSVLTRYLPKAKVRKEKNLLAGGNEDTDGEDEEVQFIIFLSVFRLYV